MEMGQNIKHDINLCENSIDNRNMWHPDQIVYTVEDVCTKACPNIIQQLTSKSRKTELS